MVQLPTPGRRDLFEVVRSEISLWVLWSWWKWVPLSPHHLLDGFIKYACAACDPKTLCFILLFSSIWVSIARFHTWKRGLALENNLQQMRRNEKCQSHKSSNVHHIGCSSPISGGQTHHPISIPSGNPAVASILRGSRGTPSGTILGGSGWLSWTSLLLGRGSRGSREFERWRMGTSHTQARRYHKKWRRRQFLTIFDGVKVHFKSNESLGKNDETLWGGRFLNLNPNPLQNPQTTTAELTHD
jgi:hypothetical protein